MFSWENQENNRLRQIYAVCVEFLACIKISCYYKLEIIALKWSNARKDECFMTERELRRLSRADLLELLLAQRRENEQLRCLLDQTQSQLTDRTIQINNAGSIAEASLQLSGIFDAAQDSCKYYIDNIRQLNERQNTICQQMEQETKEKCDLMVREAEQKAQQCWDNCAEKIKQMVESFDGLQQILDAYASCHKQKKDSNDQIYGEMY